jgi:hypothetical protein
MAGENTQVDLDETNYLDMSDEELMNAPVPDFTGTADTGTDEGAGGGTDNNDDAGTDTGTDDAGQGGGDAEDDEDKNKDGGAEKAGDKTGEAGEGEEDKDPATAGKPGSESTETKDDKTPPADKKPEEKKPAKEAKAPADKGPIDYAKAGQELLAPFKANGREVQVNSVEDARALMQMGANYNKKMAALKPNLKVLKLLENHGLLDETKLSFLIDLDRKDPQAINKLVKDAGLNSMDLDPEKAGDYQPQARSVSDQEVDLDNVLDDLKESKSYSRTMNVVAKEWDKASRRVIADNPHVLRLIHDQIDSGVFDQITAEVENERTFGRLQGLSDIEAYKQVGDRMFLKPGNNSTGRSQGTAAGEKEVVQPKPRKDSDAQREEKRRAASGNRPAPVSTKAGTTDLNPLALSDEEFEKRSKNHFR